MSSRTIPIFLENAVYDTLTRTLYTGSAECDIVIVCPPTTATSQKGLPSIGAEGVFDVNRPTYMCTYFHYCFCHVYLDYILPLLSILNEADAQALASRDFRMFILKDTIFFPNENTEEQLKAAKNDFQQYLSRKIDFEKGEYKGELRKLHTSFSKHPIFFEHTSTYRFYRFKKLILGGNIDNQRCIHNHISNYPDRFKGEPEASPEQIHKWLKISQKFLADFLGISDTPSPPVTEKPCVIVISRKEGRTFLPQTITRLEITLGQLETIAFEGVLYLDEMSLEEQIRLFQRVDVVISTHGSALAHLIWSKPGTRVLEVFLTAERRLPIFKYLADFMGFQYLCHIVNPDVQYSTDNSFNVDEAFWQKLDTYFQSSI
jgi:hypothetical protein